MALPLGLMQVKDFYDRREALFVDARDRAVFRQGHIDGAVSLPAGEAERELPGFARRFPPTTLVVVYCNGFGCHDSRSVAERLLRAGYQSVFVYEGGFPEWRDAGYPTGGGDRGR
jgi:rhodanese-related sulfurtransferase